MAVTIEQLAFNLISVFEGVRLTAYQDSGLVWTIGIGHTGPEVHAGVTITAEEAVALFKSDSAPLFVLVADLSVSKAAALVSFGYNCGRGALVKVLAGDDTIMNPRHTQDRHGTVLTGLVNRRRLEQTLCDL